MNPTDSFQESWEQYWSQTAAVAYEGRDDAGSIWDIDPERSAARDVERLKRWIDPALPLIDLGCGNGLQTRHLAKHLPRVIGTDVAPAAVELAQRIHGAPNLEYRVLDVFDTGAVERFHAEYGDLNVYFRTLLHFVQPGSEEVFARSIATLLGKRGTLYLAELGAEAPAYFAAWIERHGMPARLGRVLATGVKPGSVSPERVRAVFSAERFTLLEDGDFEGVPVQMRVAPPPGVDAPVVEHPWAPPGYFAVLRPRSAEAAS